MSLVERRLTWEQNIRYASKNRQQTRICGTKVYFHTSWWLVPFRYSADFQHNDQQIRYLFLGWKYGLSHNLWLITYDMLFFKLTVMLRLGRRGNFSDLWPFCIQVNEAQQESWLCQWEYESHRHMFLSLRFGQNHLRPLKYVVLQR